MRVLLCVLAFPFLFLSSALSQPNSVHLLDSTGAVIGQHPSITAAYAAIPEPIAQRYLIEVQALYDASLETIPLVFTLRTGASEANTVTIRPAAGVTGKQISGTLTAAIVSFDDADYVTLDGRPGGLGSTSEFTIQNLSASGTNAHTIQFTNGATHNTVQYVRTLNGTAATAGPRNIAFTLSASNVTGNSDNRILFCSIEGGRTGVGSNGTVANPNVRNLVHGCDIKDWGYTGIWMQAGTDEMTIDSNAIHQTIGENITNPSGINFSITSRFTATVTRNRIYDVRATSTSTSLTIRGIWTLTNPGAASVLNIVNNFVALVLDNANAASVYGIHLGGPNDYTANVIYNSVLIGGTHTGGASGALVSAAFVKRAYGAGSVFTVRNNIFRNDRAGGTAGVIHTGGAVDSVAGTIDMNHNAHWAAAGGGFHARWATIPYSDLPSYRAAAAPNEASATFYGAEFVSSSDLHLTGGSVGNPELAAVPIAGITTDIDAELRNPSTPNRGADEVAGGGVVITVALVDGWNMLSNPVLTPADSVLSLYPQSVFPYAFRSAGGTGYQQEYRMQNGTGYWAKLPASPSPAVIGGTALASDSVEVAAGWNLVGTISDTVDTAAITSDPPGLRGSPWFGYTGSYAEVPRLIPGQAYWVKATSNGTFFFSGASPGLRSRTHAPSRQSGTPHQSKESR